MRSARPDCQAYVTGNTQSTTAQDFPVTGNAFQNILKGASSKSNATFLVFHPDGSILDYGTYYGGSGNGTNADAGIGVAVDSSGNGYITGVTYSTDLVTMNPAIAMFQGTTNTGANAVSNAFVAEFNPTAANGPASLLYATYLGGSGATGTINLTIIGSTSISVGDVGTGIAIDSNNKIWVTGLPPRPTSRLVPSERRSNRPITRAPHAAVAAARLIRMRRQQRITLRNSIRPLPA